MNLVELVSNPGQCRFRSGECWTSHFAFVQNNLPNVTFLNFINLKEKAHYLTLFFLSLRKDEVKHKNEMIASYSQNFVIFLHKLNCMLSYYSFSFSRILSNASKYYLYVGQHCLLLFHLFLFLRSKKWRPILFTLF